MSTTVEEAVAGERVRAFLCHASGDKALARKLAEDLQANGVETFFDAWEIRSGESIRQKLDEGLGGCTHFIVLLTAASLTKPWVQTEMDAGFVRRVEGSCRFIPLRHGVEVSALPPLLRSMHAPAFDDYDADFRALLADLYGVSRRPALGAPPEWVQADQSSQVGLSPLASRLARLLAERSEHGVSSDPQLEAEEVQTSLAAPVDDIVEAVDELEALGLVNPIRALGDGALGFHVLAPTDDFFAQVDSNVMPWNPEQDAIRIASELLASDQGANLKALAESYGWAPRRLNPAVSYLILHGACDHDESRGSQPFRCFWITRNVRTRRFVRERE